MDFIAKALESGWCETAYDDDEAIILKIRDVKGKPPADSVDDGKDSEIEDVPPDEANSNEKNANDNPDVENDNGQSR